MSYFDRLSQRVAERGRLCVGVDPHPGIVKAWGYDYTLAGVEKVARGMVEALGPSVAVYKPQSAFFEAFGSGGLAVLARVLEDIRQADAISILDVKRGDIGSTMSAYAQAYLSGSTDLDADAITVSPFLGFGALDPALEMAMAHDKGLYVLCRTSNPQAVELQTAQNRRGRSVAQMIVDQANVANVEARTPFVGLVIGATLSELQVDLDDFDGSILAPGIGAQGATIAGLADLFGAHAPRVLASASRSIMSAGPDPESLRKCANRHQQ